MKDYTLIIDTSIFGAGIGFFDESSKHMDFLEVSNDVADSARQLPLMVANGLSRLCVELHAIRKVIVSHGPGSFTGIRVGMGYAFGFLSGLQLTAGGQPKITGISSLVYLARSLVSDIGGRIILFLAATKTTGYVVFSDGAELIPKSFDVTGVDADRFLLDHKKANWILIGEWEQVMGWAKAHQIESVRAMQGRDAVKLAIRSIGESLKKEEPFEWKGLDSANLPMPVYLRKSTVEEKAALSP